MVLIRKKHAKDGLGDIRELQDPKFEISKYNMGALDLRRLDKILQTTTEHYLAIQNNPFALTTFVRILREFYRFMRPAILKRQNKWNSKHPNAKEEKPEQYEEHQYITILDKKFEELPEKTQKILDLYTRNKGSISNNHKKFLHDMDELYDDLYNWRSRLGYASPMTVNLDDVDRLNSVFADD